MKYIVDSNWHSIPSWADSICLFIAGILAILSMPWMWFQYYFRGKPLQEICSHCGGLTNLDEIEWVDFMNHQDSLLFFSHDPESIVICGCQQRGLLDEPQLPTWSRKEAI